MAESSTSAAFTIVAGNYLPYALVLGESFLDNNPSSNFYCVVIDEELAPRVLLQRNISFIGYPELSRVVTDFWRMAAMYDVTEFATALKPFVLEYLLDAHEVVLYIDPDICVYRDLGSIIEKTAEHGWSLTPHCLEPMMRDGLTPSEADIMQSGVFNLGYIGVTREAAPMLKWWQQRLLRDAISDPARQLFTDQRWIDLAAVIFDPYIEKSPSYNVAYWNLDQRDLCLDGHVVTTAGEPLHFFHFSGFNPTTPWWLSKHHPTQPRNLVSSSPALELLCADYSARVSSAFDTDHLSTPYRWNEVLPGFSMSPSIRRYFRDECIGADRGENPMPPDPYASGAARFLDWLSEPREDRILPRAAEIVLSSRPDLLSAFGPCDTREQAGAFLEWIRFSGRAELPWLSLVDLDRPRNAPNAVDPRQATSSPLHPPVRSGVDVIGYLSSELGVGEAGRLLASAIETAGVEIASHASARSLSRKQAGFKEFGTLDHRVRVLAVNADQVPLIADDLGLDELSASYVIGQWFWELEEFPETYQKSFEIVDEVWAATTFTANAIRDAAPIGTKIHHMPIPLVAPSTNNSLTRADFGLDNRYLFLFSFDMLSVVERKNPFGLIEAYRQAFSEGDGAQLVIKCINGRHNLQALERLRWESKDRSDVAVIDNYMARSDSGRLMELADCYVSLHRSEGLGLTMSEAMCLGVPVIATGYSGNIDFMTSENSVLVPWEYARVGENAAPYSPDAMWANPDLDYAALAMRQLADDPGNARKIGSAGRQHLADHFSVVACGQSMKERLEAIERECGHA